MLNLRSLDLNLLTVFEAVYECGNQGQAAQRLAMTAPAVSNALSRLRHVVQDELFIAAGRGIQPTPGAHRLYRQVHSALDMVREGIAGERGFDPASASTRFKLAISYAGGAAWASRLLQALRTQAPGVSLSIQSVIDPEESRRALQEGLLDLLIDYQATQSPLFAQQKLMAVRRVVIARRDHPRVQGRISKRQLFAEEHVAQFEPDTRAETPGAQRHVEGRALNIVMEVPTALALPVVVSQTDCIDIISEPIAALFADSLGLQMLDAPVELPRFANYLQWSLSRERDPGHRWLRERIIALWQGETPSPA